MRTDLEAVEERLEPPLRGAASTPEGRLRLRDDGHDVEQDEHRYETVEQLAGLGDTRGKPVADPHRLGFSPSGRQ